MCKVLEISRSSYYHWLKIGQRKTKQSFGAAKDKIAKVHRRSKNTYGSPRIADDLQAEGLEISRSTVARLMKEMGLRSKVARKFKATTDSKHGLRVADNLLNRKFTQGRINAAWVSDITYIRIKQKWYYLTTIMDLADRMIIAWTLTGSMDAYSTTVRVWKAAIAKRPLNGSQLIFHSDRGVQYACDLFKQQLTEAKTVTQSMSRKGNCWDNAVAESFFKTIKAECLNHYQFKSYENAYKVIFDYIEGWYNTRRKHSTLGLISPLEKFYSLTHSVS